MIWRVVLISRSAGLYAVMLIGLSMLSWALGTTGILINLAFFRPDVRLPYPEISALLAGALGAAILRPRFWEWDRVATRRAAIVAAAVALVGGIGPVLVVAAGTFALPAPAPIGWRFSNAVVICASIFVVVPFLGPMVTGAVAILTYFLLGLATNLWFDPTLIPLTRPPDAEPHWLAAAIVTLLAAAVHYRTRGATPWSQRVFARDD